MLPTIAGATPRPARFTPPRERVAAAPAGRWSAARVAELVEHRRPLVPAPRGMRYADSPVAWLRQVERDARIISLRADLRANVLAVAGVLARGWHPVTVMSSPGHDVMCAELRCTKRTAGRLIQRLIDLGWILRTGEGRTRVWGEARVLRAEYVLLEPQPALTSRRQPAAVAEGFNWRSSPATKRDRLAAAAALVGRIRVVSVSAIVSVPAVASVLRPFFVAGWTLADVWHAIEHRPTEGPWTYETSVQVVAGWVRSRLSWWVRTDGQPRQSRSQQEKAAQDAARKAAAERAAQAAAERAVAVPADAVPEWREARRQLGSRGRGGDEVSQNVAPSLTLGESSKNTHHARTREAKDDRAAPGLGTGYASFQQARRAMAQRPSTAAASGAAAPRRPAVLRRRTPDPDGPLARARAVL